MYQTRFESYFSKPVAEEAARSLSKGSEIEFQITSADSAKEIFTFQRQDKKNHIKAGPASSPQIRFILTCDAADQILEFKSDNVGEIGIHILKIFFSESPSDKKPMRFEIESGFLGLLSKGYLGVLAQGGAAFAGFLASKGLGGMSAIKAALAKSRRK